MLLRYVLIVILLSDIFVLDNRRFYIVSSIEFDVRWQNQKLRQDLKVKQKVKQR